MKATTPPACWASARMCWQSVVLPDASGPKISVIRPRGMPPTPRARSSATDPVEMTSMGVLARSPRRMIEPVPNCFSIALIAALTAFPRSPSTAFPFFSARVWCWSVAPWMVIVSLLGGRRPTGSLLFLDLLARLALGLDHFDAHGRLEDRLDRRFDGSFLRLL